MPSWNRPTRRSGRRSGPRAAAGRPSGPLVLILALTAAIPGCSRDRRPPLAPPAAPAARLLRPAAGDSAAGEVPVLAAVTDAAIRRLVLRVEGTPEDTLLAPDWTGLWRAPGVIAPSETRLSLWDASAPGIGRRLDSVTVVVIPNGSPRLRLVWPRPTRWLARDSGTALEAEATDPEDGLLAAERICWTGPALRRPLIGASLPVEILPEEEQTLEVRAIDRWGAAARARVSLRPYRYSGAHTPEGCLRDLASAYRGLDPERLADLLDPRFRFLPCRDDAESAGWPAAWEREEFLSLWRRWVETGDLAWPEWELGYRLPAAWSCGDTLFAWAAADPSLLSAGAEDPPGFASSAAGLGAPRPGADAPRPGAAFVVRSCHRFFLRRSPHDCWRLLVWRELPGADGSSLASRLAAASSRKAAPRPRAAARQRGGESPGRSP